MKLHNLFGDVNAVHISVDSKGYVIEQTIDGETIQDVLRCVEYDTKKMVRTLETWVTKAVKTKKITLEEGKEFLNNYRNGLYGYTYLERDWFVDFFGEILEIKKIKKWNIIKKYKKIKKWKEDKSKCISLK